MKKITFKDFEEALPWCWSRETSSDKKNWTPDNPAYGQCLPTAILFKKYFGGNLVVRFIRGVGWHNWNRLPNGKEKDLTASQFKDKISFLPGKIIDEDGSLEKHFLSIPWISERFKILESRMAEYFKNKGGKG